MWLDISLFWIALLLQEMLLKFALISGLRKFKKSCKIMVVSEDLRKFHTVQGLSKFLYSLPTLVGGLEKILKYSLNINLFN
jgi:hypothetical protein